MATKNKPAAKAAPKEEVALTAGQKAAATKKAKAAAAEPPVKATKAVKAVAEPVAKPKAAKPKAEPVDAKPAPAKAVKAVVAKVAEVVEVESADTVGRKQLADGVRTRLQAAGFGVSPALTLAMVQAFEEAVSNTLASGSDITLPGFGKFKVAMRPGGPRRNPRDGTTMDVAPSWAVSFKVGKALKVAANIRPAE